MNVRALSTGLMFAVAVAAGASYAQQPAAPRTVAKLTGMEGNVLVSSGDAMVAAGKEQRVPPGVRVVTTAGAKVTIAYDAGCDVRLNENKRFTVREFGECAALIASVESLAPAAGAVGGTAAGGAAAGIGTTGIIVGSLAFGGIAYGIYDSEKDDDNVSPN